MKKLTCLSLALMGYLLSFCQHNAYVLSEKDWNNLVSLLNREQWKEAEKRCARFLGKCGDDNRVDPPVLRYMYIRSVAAQLGDRKYTKKAALKKVGPMTGKTVLTPPTEFNPDRMFNGLKLTEEGTAFMTCSSNRDMTVIHCFEYFFFMDPDVVRSSENYLEKNLRIGATVKNIEAAGDMMPRLDIVFENAFVWVED